MSIRTDLALEIKDTIDATKLTGIESSTITDLNGINITTVTILDDVGSRTLGKPIGNYITIEAASIKSRDIEIEDNVIQALSKEIKKLLPTKKDFTALVVGLGNKQVTADALGPYVLEKTMITRHIKEYIPIEIQEKVRSVCAISPGVLGITGIESASIVKSVSDSIKPDLIILIDSLASKSTSRIGTTFQITDTGISPGSGIGNKRIALNKDTLGAQVIAIGVPMVVYATTIAHDILIHLVENNKKAFEEKTVSNLIQNILPEDIGELVVTPKEIDLMIEDTARIIASSLNISLHKDVDLNFANEFIR